MFDFLKKRKPQDLRIIPEPQQELKLSVRQRALNVFTNIEGLDDIKEMMLRALESSERAHTLLTGPLHVQISLHAGDRKIHVS